MSERNKQKKLQRHRKQFAKRRDRQAAIQPWITFLRELAAKVRPCGKCTACCTVMGVKELGKPPQRPCPHVTEDGCAIYDHRPESCRDFGCLWLFPEMGDESVRPDELGVMFNLSLESASHMPVCVLQAWEANEGAMRTKRVQDVARRLERDLKVTCATTWYPANLPVPVNYPIDPDRWPEDVKYGCRSDKIHMEPEGERDLVYKGDKEVPLALPVCDTVPVVTSEPCFPP